MLRLWSLGNAHDLMNQFDETYYVKDAWTLSRLGYEGSWPSTTGETANDRFLSGDVNSFSKSPSFVVHPPLGKWIISLGMMAISPANGWGWRIMTVLLGTASVLLLMLIAKRMTRSTTFAVIAGLLMAIDGLAISMSRVALLDTPLMFFVLLGFLFVLKDRERTMTRIAETVAARYEGDQPPLWGPILWNRPWIIAAGAALGAATAVKWSGVWVLAGLGVYLVVTDALARRRAGVLVWPTDALRQSGATFLLLVPVAFVVYLASWTGWLVTDGGYDRHVADANPATGLLVMGAAAAAEPVDLPRHHVQLRGRDHQPPRLQEPRLAVAAAAAPHRDVLPPGRARPERVPGGERLLDGGRQHPESRSSGTRASPPSST